MVILIGMGLESHRNSCFSNHATDTSQNHMQDWKNESSLCAKQRVPSSLTSQIFATCHSHRTHHHIIDRLEWDGVTLQKLDDIRRFENGRDGTNGFCHKNSWKYIAPLSSKCMFVMRWDDEHISLYVK